MVASRENVNKLKIGIPQRDGHLPSRVVRRMSFETESLNWGRGWTEFNMVTEDEETQRCGDIRARIPIKGNNLLVLYSTSGIGGRPVAQP